MCARCDVELATEPFIPDVTHVKGEGSSLREFSLTDMYEHTKERASVCWYCGMSLLDKRPVRRLRARKIGGKRGRNSGKVSNHGKKV